MASEYKEKIEGIPLFSALGPPLRAHLADILVDIGKVRVLNKGELLYAENAADDNTGAVLVDGVLMVTAGEYKPFTIAAPDVVGEMQQLNAYGVRTATVCATDPSVVLEFTWHDFVARIKDDPGISDTDQAAIHDAFAKIAGERFKRR